MQTPTNTRDYLTPQEVADTLDVHVSAVYRSVEAGRLPSVRLAEHGAIRIPRSALRPTMRTTIR